MAKKQEKEVERWVTVNGARVPIFKDGSIGGPKELRDKLKAHQDKKSTDKKEWDIENTMKSRQALKKAIDDYRAEHRNPTPEDRKIVKQMRDKYDAMLKENTDKIKTKVNAELDAKSKRHAQEKELEDLKKEHFKLSKHDEDDIPSRDAKLNSLEKQIKEKEDQISSNKSSTKNKKETSVKDLINNAKNGDKIQVEEFSSITGKPTGNTIEYTYANGRWSSAGHGAFDNDSKGFSSINSVKGTIPKIQKVDGKKKETNGETKHYSVYQPKNILGDETHTHLERIEAKSEAEAVAKYKEKYPKASDENIGISRTTKEGGRYQNPDGSWDDGHMYKNSKKTSTSKTPEFKNAEEAEKYYQEKFNNVSSTYANKLATQMGIEGRGKEKRAALAKAYTEKWKQSQNISNNEDLKEKQIAKNKVEKDEINKQQKDISTKTPQAKEFGVESSIKDYADLKEAYNKKMSGDGYKVVSNNAGFIGDYVTTPSGDKYTIVKSSWNDTYYIYKGRGRTDERPTMDKFNSSKEALEWLKNNDTGAKSKKTEFRKTLTSKSTSILKSMYANASTEEEKRMIAAELGVRGYYRKQGKWSSSGGGR